MKRIFILLISVICLISLVAAQNNELPSCDSATIAENESILNEYAAILLENDLSLDELSSTQSAYWFDVYPFVPICSPLFELGFNIGRAFDERLIIAGMEAVDVDTSARGNVLQTLLDDISENIEPEEATEPVETQTYYVVSNSAVNLRTCGSTTCSVAATANRGDALRVVDDSGEWYEVLLDNGETAYIAAFLVSINQPSSVQPTRVPQSNPPQPTQDNSNANAVAPTNPPPPPTENQSVAPPAASFTCNCDKTCEQMASCDEAYFQLNQCGCGRRDGDGDGVPCEDICSGG